MFLLIILLGCKEVTKNNKLNFIILQADDLGWSDLGIHGNPYVETPNINRLASESLQFSNFYVTPVCAPTRAALLTGRHHLLTGVSHVHGGKDFVDLEETMIAEVLQENGYATGMWGKWHSGKTEGYFPWQRGFEEAYMARLYQHENSEGLLNGEKVTHQKWADEVIVNYAIDFIQRNKEKPFFAYLSFLTCHSPLETPEKYKQKYMEEGLSENLSTLYGMIEHMDHHIGRLLKQLEEKNLNENTILFFMSDNGPAIINNLLSDHDREIRYVNNYNGHKGNIWENGVKSPLFIKPAGSFEPKKINRLVDITDIFPTIVDLARIDHNGDFSGRSFSPYLNGITEDLPGKTLFLYANGGWPPTERPWTPRGIENEYAPVTEYNEDMLNYEKQIIAIRNENYKLLFNPSPRETDDQLTSKGYYLVDMKNDPKEDQNVFEKFPDVSSQMINELKKWHQETFYAPHAFNMPVFIVDAELENNEILGYGPYKFSKNLVNTAFYLTGWENAGDFASYKIKVNTPGKFKPVIYFDGNMTGKTFSIHTSNQEVIQRQAENNQVHFPAINLDENDQYISLKLKNMEQKSIDLRINKIVLLSEKTIN